VTRYLADTSIWSWANNAPGSAIASRLAERVERDEIVTTPIVVLETLHRARSDKEYELVRDALFGDLELIPITRAGGERALAVQRALAFGGHGNHRRPATDFLVAAAAEEAGSDVTLWFYDKDLEVICEHTGQPFEAEKAA
jgi:predicted nucleic acid-binding protein